MSDSTAFTIRPAARSECRTIAELYRISSDGVAEYIWTKIAKPGENILDVGQRRYAEEDSVFSYRNCSMVDWKWNTAGMIIAFPMEIDDEYVESDPVLVPYSKLEEPDSYYICGMAVFPEYRGRGIGTQLLQHAERRSREHGLSKLSLIVFEKNAGAKRLYERSGYSEKAHEPVVPHPLIHFDGRAVLMVKDLDG
ncbi:GNAT family N-acetyltransferase [Gammaproteobacteria bacterium]|jgi:GNAT superfamily N-acetyltransferase|nr:GNAT family N-acetyltransferase [Gammaproteobacteria bacterium]